MQVALGHTTTRLPMSGGLRGALGAAIARGRDEAAGWARIHPTGSTRRFDADARASLQPPPTGAERAAELEELLEIQRQRTDAGRARVRELDARAGWETWERVIDDIGRTQGVEQARRAQRLVDDAARRTHHVVNDAKWHFARLRPFEADARIEPLVARSGGNPSYPSGHTSGAFAAALVLAALVPDRAEELVGLAAEVGFSRMYGGVHYRSDVVEGARIAARVVADVLRRDAEQAA